MNSNDFTSADRIIASVVMTVDDADFKKGFSKGWYMSHVQQAFQDLCVSTRYLKVQQDVELPSLLQLQMPPEVFDIREIYLYNGTLCNPDKTQVVHWKRLFNNTANGTGYTARVKDDGSNPSDIFLPNQDRNSNNYLPSRSQNTYYYNVLNGLIMFSHSCASYPFVRVIYNGFGGAVGDEPIIPRFFERAIIDYVEERFYNAMKARNPRTFRILWGDAQERLTSFTGAWATAIKRIKTMDRAEKASMDEYISSMYHK